MLRWYLAGLAVLMIVIGVGVYHYVMTHPAEPGTFTGRIYEKVVKSKLSKHCTGTMERLAKSHDSDTEARVAIACDCFTTQMFAKFRDVPPGQLDAVAEEEATARVAEGIFNRCFNEAGLN